MHIERIIVVIASINIVNGKKNPTCVNFNNNFQNVKIKESVCRHHPDFVTLVEIQSTQRDFSGSVFRDLWLGARNVRSRPGDWRHAYHESSMSNATLAIRGVYVTHWRNPTPPWRSEAYMSRTGEVQRHSGDRGPTRLRTNSC